MDFSHEYAVARQPDNPVRHQRTPAASAVHFLSPPPASAGTRFAPSLYGGLQAAHPFSSQGDAQTLCRNYFVWYNTRHHPTGLVLLTPEQAHFGDAPKLLAQRQVTLDAAYAAPPERFRERPQAGQWPAVVWINAPALSVAEVQEQVAA